MTKRWFITVLLASFVGSLLFAEVRIKSVDANTVEITFLFKNPASEMNVIGNFDNWTVPGEPMTKNADGVWEKTITANATDEIQYKFYSKGTWIFDPMAPDKKDDGYGGYNGLIVVADILSGVTQLPSSDAGVNKNTNAASPKDIRSKLNFGTSTVIGSRTTFLTQGLVDKTQKGLETDQTGIYARSGINFNGTLLPNVSAFLDMKLFEGYKNIWAQDPTGKVDPDTLDGLRDVFSGMLINPVYYFNGADSNLKALKAGIETPYLKWETGYGEARSTKRQPILWTTLNDRNGDTGYTRFDIGESLRSIGSGRLDAGFMPNRFRGEMGAITWIGYEFGSQKIDFQYDLKSAQDTELFKFFDKIYHQDFLLGYKIRFDAFEIKAQGLLNVFSEETFDIIKDTAFGGQISYDRDGTGVLLRYRYTGDRANMLYGDNDGDLGRQASQKVVLNLFAKPNNIIKAGIDSETVIGTYNLDNTDIELYTKPWAEINLEQFVKKSSSINTYAKFKYNFLKDYVYTASQAPYQFGEFGTKWYLSEPIKGITKGIDVYYGINNWDNAKILHSLVSSTKFTNNVSLELGTGLRLVRDNQSDNIKKANNLIGFAIGSSWKVPVASIKTPLLYGAFVYNMDPLGEGSLAMSDFVTDGGADKMNGLAQLRLMLKWEF